MQLTPDCIRDVLLEFETFHMDVYKVDAFQNCLSRYGKEQTLYTLIKLFEGGYINGRLERSRDGQLITFQIYDITFQGHEFLEKIRSDTIWNNNVKPMLLSIGSKSLSLISDIASSIIASKLNL